jgi:hypothetical protein
MLLEFDGFDHYTTTGDTAANVVAYLQAAGYSVLNASNATFGLAAGQDVNSLGVKMTVVPASSTPPSFSRSIITAGTLVVFGFSFRGTGSRYRIARINDLMDIEWDVTTGKLKYGVQLGPDVIILNAHYSIEVEIDKTTNEVRVWANNALQLTFTLVESTTTHKVQWGVTAAQANGGTIEVDDFYIVDNTGGANNARLGPVQVVTRAPTADLEAEWIAVGSTGTHASIAAQLSPNAPNAPYLQANIEGKTDLFSSTGVLPNNNQVFGVNLVAYARKGDLDDRQLGLLISTAGGEVEVEAQLTTSYAYRRAVFEKAPGNVDWTQANVESSNFGIVAR